MFAESGTTLPFGVGTVTPEAVANAVVKALRTNRAEIDVAPITLRAGALLGSVTPGISAAVQARVGRCFKCSTRIAMANFPSRNSRRGCRNASVNWIKMATALSRRRNCGLGLPADVQAADPTVLPEGRAAELRQEIRGLSVLPRNSDLPAVA